MNHSLLIGVVALSLGLLTTPVSAKQTTKHGHHTKTVIHAVNKKQAKITKHVAKPIITANRKHTVIAKNSSSLVKHKPILVSKVSRELECLAYNVQYEAGSESYEGKIAVAQVAVNRSHDPRYPGSICGVISQKTHVGRKSVCQFSWYCDRKKRGKPSPESYEVAVKVLQSGYRIARLNKALYFHARHVHPRWRMTRIAMIGNHIFYRDIKRA